MASSAAATSAFTPRSGSRPACAALPSTSTAYQDVPLRAVFRAESTEGSRTSTASACMIASAIRARDACEPISSSVVRSMPTPLSSVRPARASAAQPCTTPAFMSKTPGPVIRWPSLVNGRRASEPIGHTVSR